MNRINGILLLFFSLILFTACQTGKSIQLQMQGIQSELFYELTTPVYSESVDNTIYLNSIENSAIIPYTAVKRKGGKVIPLIFYNLIQNNYEVTLGDGSLVQPYHDFLMDALLTQCNRSSCFNLRMRDDAALSDSTLILEVKVNKNSTTADMIHKDVGFFIPISADFIFGFSNWDVNQSVSWLEISARLMQQEKCLWEKTYTATRDLSYKKTGIENPNYAYEYCIDHMTECLSNTTKEIVESIGQNLHLLMLQKQAD